MTSNHHHSTPTCVALIHNNDNDNDKMKVVIYDKKGTPRSFYVKQQYYAKLLDQSRCIHNNDVNKHKLSNNKKLELCFSDHDIPHVSDLLTHCLDSDGLHGVPDEECYCGEDEAHLHAHLYNELTCSDDYLNLGCISKKQPHQQIDIGCLGSVTLYPDEHYDCKDEEDCVVCDTTNTIPSSEAFPNECNSLKVNNSTCSGSDNDVVVVEKKDEQVGSCVKGCCSASASDSVKDDDHDDNARSDSCCGQKSNLKETKDEKDDSCVKGCCDTNRDGDKDACKSDANGLPERSMFQIKHDNHHDTLVHNSKTGDMHLEHSCNTCHDTDIHGSLKLAAKRKLGDHGRHSLHFYKVPPPNEPFSILDFLAKRVGGNALRISNDRVDVILGTPKKDKSMSSHSLNYRITEQPRNILNVRSKFHAKGICCSSEIPPIRTLLIPIKGVWNVTFNIPQKLVYVDHEFKSLSADEICKVLKSFGAVVLKDGADDIVKEIGDKEQQQKIIESIPRSSFVESLFRIDTKQLDIRMSTLTITGWKSCIQSAFQLFEVDGGGIRRWDIEFTHGSTILVLKIEHDPNICTASEIHKKLMEKIDSSPNNVLGDDLENGNMSPIAILTDGGALRLFLPNINQDYTDEMRQSQNKYPKPHIMAAGILWIVSLFSFVSQPAAVYLKYVAIASCVFSLPSIAIKAVRTMRRYQFDTNGMMIIAAAGAIVLGEYVEAAAVGFLYGFSEYLEALAGRKAKRALAAVVESKGVWGERSLMILPNKGSEHEDKEMYTWVPATAIPPNSLLLIRPGDSIPCDGTVRTGSSLVNESSLTGEPRGVPKTLGDSVYSGTINTGTGALHIETLRWSNQSALHRLQTLVEEAQTRQSETMITIDKFARVYTPVVLGIAICVVIIPTSIAAFRNVSEIVDVLQEWVYHALVLLVVACPCALVISTPVCYVAALAACARKGIIVRGGAFLELLGRCNYVCFDKTGTLTYGECTVTDVEFCKSNLTHEEVLQLWYNVQAPSGHPIATSILAYLADKHGVNGYTDKSSTYNVDDKNAWEVLEGKGVTGVFDNTRVYCGNTRLVIQILGKEPHELLQASVRGENHGKLTSMSITKSQLYLLTDNEILANFSISDRPRREAPEVIGELTKNDRFKVTMLTGDTNEQTAKSIASYVGLSTLDNEQLKFGLLPSDKLKYVELKKKEHVVCMVGDGINDAPALAAADIGVAVGSGSAALAMETSAVTLMDDESHDSQSNTLFKLVFALKTGKRTIHIIWQNIVFSIAAKTVVFILAILGKASLWEAIFADVGSMLIVTLNGMRLIE